MDIGKAFTFTFEDQEWINKVLIGTLITLISILLSFILIGLLGFAILSGYQLEVLRNVRQGNPRPLPAWRDRWGEWMVLGLKLLVVVLVWSIPFILLAFPLIIGGAATDSEGWVSAVGGLLIALSCVLLGIWTIVLLLVTPALYIRLAETEQISSALRFGEILSFTRDHIGEVLVATVVYIVASFLLSMVGGIAGTILCLVGLIITVPAASFITMLIQAHLYAQIGADEDEAMLPEQYAAT